MMEVIGVKELEKILEEIAPRHARNLMRATVHAVAGKVKKEIKDRTPRDTGNLKQSLTTKRRRSKPDQPISDVIFKSNKADGFYWRFIEHGTTDLPERPFVRPAKELIFSKMPQIMREEFGKKLERLLARQAKK